MDPLGAIQDSRECVKLDDLVPWQNTLGITEFDSPKAMEVTKKDDADSNGSGEENGKSSDAGTTATQGNCNGVGSHTRNEETVIEQNVGDKSATNSGGSDIQHTNDNFPNGKCVTSEVSVTKTHRNAEMKGNGFQNEIASPTGVVDQSHSAQVKSENNILPVNENSSIELQFPYQHSLNSKIYLWNGDIAKLSVQGLILPVYEVLSRSSYLHASLLYHAGPRLLNDCRRLSGLRTSEVRVNHGYDLPARFAVHTVEPRFNPKYQSAADTALHACYRSALQACAEKGLRTVAISPLHITRRGFPLATGSMVALRTIRKCLEVLESKFDAVVVVTDKSVVETYLKLFPAYFPRSEGETQAQLELLPQNIPYNEWGEILQQERAIRIPDISQIKRNNSDQESREQESDIVDIDGSVIDLTLGPRSFSQMSGDHDEKRKFMLTNNLGRENFQAQERIYKRLLRIARNENFSQFSAMRAVKVSGYDVTVNRVIVIIGRLLVFSEIDLEKFLLYLMLTFDSVVNEPYTIVYFHTETMDFNRPSTDYLRKLYNTFDQRYKSNLARLCLVHMNRLARFRTWLNMTFFAREIRDRIVHVQTIPDLYKIVSPDQIDIPPFVLNHDMKVNPQAYNVTPRRSPTNVRNPRDSEINL